MGLVKVLILAILCLNEVELCPSLCVVGTSHQQQWISSTLAGPFTSMLRVYTPSCLLGSECSHMCLYVAAVVSV